MPVKEEEEEEDVLLDVSAANMAPARVTNILNFALNTMGLLLQTLRHRQNTAAFGSTHLIALIMSSCDLYRFHKTKSENRVKLARV
jgi:hypothetical protein